MLLGIWASPSAAITKGAADAMKALDDASKEAQTLLAKVPRLNETLKPSGLAITLP